ncbi:high affinity immunoglobulin gamma Fc receptor I-like isoform X1 [Labeo rohita]|nr:high affinity immunoglobulin gamma Fc receptor I-like isoform X1 [Labeo rohita]RXN25918.1 high affinity immunoglobulin gamma Fc receptor I-like isoform X1 [Labeo rohita]
MDMRSLLILSVLLALIKEYEGQTPRVTLLPKFPQVFVGDDVTLICNHKKEIKPTKWFINGGQQTHENYSMLLTAVTPKNNGEYQCEQDGSKSDPYTLTVLGGAVMTDGEGRNLVLQTDDDPKDWICFVLRGESGFALGVDVDEKAKRGVIFAELKEAERATFWCKKKKTELRSNAVTLKKTELMVMLVPPAVPALQGENVALRCVVWGGPKLESAVFYKDQTKLKSSPEDTYTIINATPDDNGKYSCHATYRFSHISAEAGRREGDSDAQELKVIASESVNVMPIMLAAILIILGVLIVVLIALKRRRGGSSIEATKRDKDKTAGGDYEQIQLKDKDTAVYHTLGESAGKDQAEGGYEALQQRKEEGVYHTLVEGQGQGQGQGEGGYEALKSVKTEVYQTLSSDGSGKGQEQGQGQGQGEGGYEALKSVKAEVYQTLSSDGSKKPEGEAEGGYEQLPQKDKDYQAVTVEDNPYEEVKKQASKEKE